MAEQRLGDRSIVVSPGYLHRGEQGWAGYRVHRARAAKLVASDNGFPNVLPSLREVDEPADGVSTVLGRHTPMPNYLLGPIRVAGWGGRRRDRPLLHGKLMVLGVLTWEEDDFGQEDRHFFPTSVWWGSANWTGAAAQHLEVGSWVEDQALARHATDFLSDVLMFSEPGESIEDAPTPSLMPIEYDDEASAEYAAEYGWQPGDQEW